MVKAAASRAADPGFDSRFWGDVSGPSYTSDLKLGIPVATLPGAWRYRVSILWLGEVESLICNFCLDVAARTVVLRRSVPEIH